MNFRLRPQERLKSKILIEELFKSGKGFVSYPIKIQHLSQNTQQHKVAFSVPKRNFKRAVDRNRIKRLMREAYRLNKALIHQEEVAKQTIFFIYIAKEMSDYAQIEKAMRSGLKKLHKRIV